jgi:hypothetical protein
MGHKTTGSTTQGLCGLDGLDHPGDERLTADVSQVSRHAGGSAAARC